MNDDPMFVRLHAALDRGEDPFDDDELVAWLDAHPEALERAAQLRADARDLATVPADHATRRHRVRPLVFAAATAVVATGLGLWWLAATTPTGRPRIVDAQFDERRPRALATAVFRVHDAHFASTTASFESYTLHHARR
jgi:hypothetical protein